MVQCCYFTNACRWRRKFKLQIAFFLYNNYLIMKKSLIITFSILTLLSCEKKSDETPLLINTIEGKWLYPSDTPGISAQGISNTMYLFENGIRYTYYCTEGDCESQYKSFKAGDGNHITRTYEYSIEDTVLTIDLNFGNLMVLPFVFECDGGRLNFQDPDFPDRVDFVRLGSACD